MKKALTALILCALICQTLASCGETAADPKDSASDNTETSAEETTSASDARAAAKDSLPDDLDFGGETFSILTRSEYPFNTEIAVEEQNADPVNDAIHKRNRSVEERLKIKLDVQPSAQGDGIDAIRKTVAAGDDVYGLVVGKSFNMPNLVTEGTFLDLNKVENLDLDKPWWVWNLREEMTLYDKLYVMAGDLTLSLIQYECCLFYNQKLWEDYDLESPYELVKSGKWTIDKVAELTKGVTKDLDGNGTLDQNDLYGIGYSDSVNIMATGYGAGMRITEVGDDGLPKLCMNSEKTYNIIAKLEKLMNEPSTYRGYEQYAKEGVDKVMQYQKDMFTSGRMLIYTGNIIDMENFRDMKNDYGILPFPKYDEAQDRYYTNSRDSYSMIAIPATCLDTARAGAVAEALASESYRTVTPQYFDVALKNKYSRDPESAEMIDLVHSSMTFNFGLCNSYTMGYVSHRFQHVFEQNKGFATLYAEVEKTAEAGLEKLIKAYKELDH